MKVSTRLVPLVVAVISALLVAADGAATAYAVSLDGVEVPPVTSTLGTFVGISSGELAATWRVQIAHQPLATGPVVQVTGGRFSILTLSGRRLSGPVTGGSVAVTNRGSRCINQTYDVRVAFSIGSFDGTLTHHRRSLFGRCIVYSASIRGRAVFNV